MSETTHKKAFRSTFYKMLELGVITTISILLTPFIIHNIGMEAYAIWLLINSIGAWNTIINLGITSAIQRSYGDAISNNDEKRISFIYSNAVFLLFLMGLLPFSAFITISYFPEWFNIWPKYYLDFSIILFVLALQLFGQFMMNCVHGLFAGNLRFDIVSKVDIVFAVFRCLVILGLLYQGYGLLGLALGHISAQAIADLSKLAIINRMFPYLKCKKSDFSLAFIKGMFRFGIQVFIDQLADMLSQKSTNILISKTGNVSSLGPFGLYANLATYYASIVSVPISIYAALIIKIHFRQHIRLLRLIISEAILALSYLSFAFGCVIAGFSEKIVLIWIGSGIDNFSLSVYLLIMATLYGLAGRPLFVSLQALGNLKSLPKWSLLLAIISVSGSFVIISRFGVLYAPVMPLFTQIMKAFIILPCLVEKASRPGWFSYYFRLFRLSAYLLVQYLFISPYIESLAIANLADLIMYTAAYGLLALIFCSIDLMLFEYSLLKRLILIKKIKARLF